MSINTGSSNTSDKDFIKDAVNLHQKITDIFNLASKQTGSTKTERFTQFPQFRFENVPVWSNCYKIVYACKQLDSLSHVEGFGINHEIMKAVTYLVYYILFQILLVFLFCLLLFYNLYWYFKYYNRLSSSTKVICALFIILSFAVPYPLLLLLSLVILYRETM